MTYNRRGVLEVQDAYSHTWAHDDDLEQEGNKPSWDKTHTHKGVTWSLELKSPANSRQPDNKRGPPRLSSYMDPTEASKRKNILHGSIREGRHGSAGLLAFSSSTTRFLDFEPQAPDPGMYGIPAVYETKSMVDLRFAASATPRFAQISPSVCSGTL